jgi:integrase
MTVKELVNQFLDAKGTLVESGELTNRSWQDYKAGCDLIVSPFGKGGLVADLDPEDFAALRGMMARKRGPVTLGNVIQRLRVVFRFAADNGLIDRPACYGQGFKRPSRKVVRIDRARKGPKLFTADEMPRLLDAAGVTMKAMILLGINCGFGNADCGHLPLDDAQAKALGISLNRSAKTREFDPKLLTSPSDRTSSPLRRSGFVPASARWGRVSGTPSTSVRRAVLRPPTLAEIQRAPIPHQRLPSPANDLMSANRHTHHRHGRQRFR